MNSTSLTREFLFYSLSIGALRLFQEGIKLKRGRISHYFFNSGSFNTGESIALLAKTYASIIKRKFAAADVIFGSAYKGIPIATAVAQAIGGNTGYAFNRREIKHHGEGGVVIGFPIRSKKVVIVDDVITTGSSIEEAIEIISEAGGEAIGCVVAFDRQERTEKNISAVQDIENRYGIPVIAAANLNDLIYLIETQTEELEAWQPLIPKLREYRVLYGITA